MKPAHFGPLSPGILGLAALSVMAVSAQADTILFQDDFASAGTHLDYSKWTTVTGSASFLGRTQLADWTPSGAGQFIVGPNGAQLSLSTFNPTGFSLYGTQGETLDSFQPTGDETIDFTTRLQLTSLQPGLVYGMYLYGCAPSLCATQHDEIDIEVVTNALQPGSTPMVELNRYAAEPLGAGHGAMVALPAGFDPLAAHNWTVLWSLNSIEYLVDGTLLSVQTTNVPQGPMEANEIAWGPASDWAAAYSPLLQPVSSAGENQTYTALLTDVTVSASQSPEPGSWMLLLTGLSCAMVTLLSRQLFLHRRAP